MREPTGPGRHSWRWRGLAFRLVAAVLIPLAVLGTLELALRAVGYGYATRFLIAVPRREGQRSAGVGGDRDAVGLPADALTANPRFGWRFFPPAIARTPQVCRIARHKDDSTFRIFVLGGSAAMGIPDPAFGFPRVLEVMLDEAYPGTDFEVVNAAMTAINSWVVVEIAEDVAAHGEPDLVLVYLGNNEVVGPFGPGTTFADFTSSRALVRTSLAVRGTRVGQLVERAVSSLSPGRTPTEWRGMEMFLDRQVAADDPRLESVYRNLAANLREIIRAARGAGAPVILSTVAVNLADSPPFASLHRADLSADDERAFTVLVERGESELGDGHPEQALGSFEAAIEIDDRHAAVQYLAGRALLAVGRTDEARARFGTARDLDALRFRADSRVNETIRQVAATEGRGGTVDLVDAERDLERLSPGREVIAGDDLFFEHVHFKFEGNYRLAWQFFEAIRSWLPDRARGDRPDPPPPSPESVRRRLPLTDRDRATLAASIRDMTDKPPFVYQLDAERRQKALREAARTLRAESRRTIGETEAAYRRVLRDRPDDLVARQKLAELLGERHKRVEAIVEWKALLERVPEVPEWMTGLGFALADAGRLDEAVATLSRVVELEPYAPEARINLGTVLDKRGDRDAAERAYLEALDLDPGSTLAFFDLGTLEENAGDLDSAAERYRRAIDLDPGSAEARFRLGALYDRQQRYDEAVAEYLAAIEIDPDLARAWNNLGYVHERQGDIDAAVREYRRAIEADPEHALAYFNLADVLLARGEAGEAAGLYRAGLVFDPGRVAARYNLAGALTVLGRTREAVEQFRSVVAQAPDLAEALHNLAWILATDPDRSLHDPAEAVRLAERARDLTGGEVAEILETLAVAYAANGDRDQARAAAARALDLARRRKDDALAAAIEGRLAAHGVPGAGR